MKLITYNGETHTFTEWCKILRSQPVNVITHEDDIPQFVQALEQGTYSNTALYNLYTMYSDTPVTKQVFEKRLVRAFHFFRPDVVRYKTRSERGWQVL